MDFSNVFDKGGHRLLIQKVKCYGIHRKSNRWIADFLTRRTQAVVIAGEHLYEAYVQSGVPQGSVLEPTPFLFYINDIAEI